MTRIASMVVALVATVLFAAPASAQDATWTVSPGGAVHGASIEAATLTIQETGVQLYCVSSTVDGVVAGGAGLTNPLGTIPVAGGRFDDCRAPFGYDFTLTQAGDWHLACDSYDGADVATCRITGIAIDYAAPACVAQLTGHLDVTFTNSTGRLTVLPGYTLVFSYVDPMNDCLGLFFQGQHVEVGAEFQVTPDLTITSP